MPPESNHVEFCIRTIGVVLEGVGVLIVVWRIVENRQWLQRFGSWVGGPLRPPATERTVHPMAASTSAFGFGGRAHLTARGGDPEVQLNNLWSALEAIHKGIEASDKELREELDAASEAAADSSRAILARLQEAKEQISQRERGDWRDGASVLSILLGIVVANYSQEIACLWAGWFPPS